jgi:hypothetical protein
VLSRRDLRLGYFDLDPSPRHTVEQQGHVEAAWLHELVRNVDGLQFSAHERQRSPGFAKGRVQFCHETVDITTDQAVDVLGGAGHAGQTVWQHGAALEQEQRGAGLVHGALKRGGDDCRRHQPAQTRAS